MSSEGEDSSFIPTRRMLAEAYRSYREFIARQAVLTTFDESEEAAKPKWALSEKLRAISEILLSSNSRSRKIYERDMQQLQKGEDKSIPGAPGATYAELSKRLPRLG